MTTANTPALPQVEIVKLLDGRLLLVALTLMLVGLVMIASASIDVADLRNDNPFHYVLRFVQVRLHILFR